MRNNKIIIGITGGSGAGKSTVSDIFRKNGIEVIDADKVAREIVEKGEAALSEIAEAFDGVLLDDGTLDRKKLGSIVFSDKNKLKILNGITHKYITARIYNLIDVCAGELCGIDGAALFESGIDKECDVMCAVTAAEDLRVKRITERDGISSDAAIARVRSQLSDEEYARRCDFTVDNGADLSSAEIAVLDIINKIKGKKTYEEKI